MTVDEMLAAIDREVQAYGFASSIEYPGYVVFADSVGRHVIIGQPDGQAGGWRCDVWRDASAHAAGEGPNEVDHLVDASVPLMVNHAIAIAARVSLAHPRALNSITFNF